MELIRDCAVCHCANSAEQPEQISRCAAISCMTAPVTAPSRYAENWSRRCAHLLTWPPSRSSRAFPSAENRNLGVLPQLLQSPPAELSNEHGHALDAT